MREGQRGDWLVILLGLVACAVMIYLIDWRVLYETFTRTIEYQIYGR